MGTTGVLKALDMTGAPLWTLERDASVQPLLVADDTVIAGPLWNDQVPLMGLEAATGAVRWEWPVSDFVSFAAVEETLFVGDGNRLAVLR